MLELEPRSADWQRTDIICINTLTILVIMLDEGFYFHSWQLKWSLCLLDQCRLLNQRAWTKYKVQRESFCSTLGITADCICEIHCLALDGFKLYTVHPLSSKEKKNLGRAGIRTRGCDRYKVHRDSKCLPAKKRSLIGGSEITRKLELIKKLRISLIFNDRIVSQLSNLYLEVLS